MSLQSIIRTDLGIIADDLANPVFTWKGEDYECVPSSTGNKLSLGEGGFSTEADLILNVDKSLFTDSVYPTAQQKITYQSITYRIDEVKNDATGAFLRLMCNEATKGI